MMSEEFVPEWVKNINWSEDLFDYSLGGQRFCCAPIRYNPFEEEARRDHELSIRYNELRMKELFDEKAQDRSDQDVK